MSILERRNRNCSETSYFLKFTNDITSQNGEDGIIERIFQLIGTSPNPFCVDVGAWDGVHLSNTFNLLKNKKWGGILFEADDFRCNGLKQLYRNRDDVICVNSLVQISGDQALGGLLSKYNIALDIDFITIDVDGADYHLWKGIGSEYCPRVVCIEFNPTIPNNVYFIQEADTRIQQGSSLLAINELGNQLGYTLVATTIFNAIFVRNDLMSLIPDYPRDLDSLHAPEMCTEMFQTYDGEIKFVGPKKLLWHKLAINPQKMQVLSKKDRKFPFAPTWDTKIKNLERRLYDVNQELKSFVSLAEVECDVDQLLILLLQKLAAVQSLFRLFLTAANELIVFQFLEGIVLNAVAHFLHQLDSVVSAVCFNSDSSDPQSPCLADRIVDAHSPLAVKRGVLVPFTFALHCEISGFYEVRGEQVKSVSAAEAVEWFRRALHVMEPNFHHSLIAVSSSSENNEVPLMEAADRDNSNQNESELNPAAPTAVTHLPLSCYDFLVQYTDVTDSVRSVLALCSSSTATTASAAAPDLTESNFSNASSSDSAAPLTVCDLQLRDIHLKLKLSKLSLSLESHQDCSHFLSSGMTQLCELSCQATTSGGSSLQGLNNSTRISRTGSGSSSKSSSNNLNASTFTSNTAGGGVGLTEAQCHQITELIQDYWKQHQKYLHKMQGLSEVEDKRLNALFDGVDESSEHSELDGSRGLTETTTDPVVPTAHREVFKEAEAKRVNKKLPKPEKSKHSAASDASTDSKQQQLQHQHDIEEQLRRSNADLESQLEDMRTLSLALMGATVTAFVFGYLLGGSGGDRGDL